jgi:hypothetical protein
MKMQGLLNAIDTYLDAIYYCDVTKLDEVFHSAASLFDADEGKIFVDPIASFRQDVATRPSPASVKQQREEDIITIDYLSPISATVKLRLRAHDNIFVDHLSFVLDDNKDWKIVAKVWHLENVINAS